MGGVLLGAAALFVVVVAALLGAIVGALAATVVIGFMLVDRDFQSEEQAGKVDGRP